MKTARTQITLSNPCHENWEAMTSVASGRYCAACNKTVTDFSLLSDGAILDILRQTSSGAACGRFLSGQLDRALVDTRYRPSFTTQLMKRVAAMLLLFQTLITTATAQHSKGNKKTEQGVKVRKPVGDIRQVKGRVLDYGVTPVAGIKVHISISGVADTITDAKGVFVFDLPVGLHDSVIKIQVKPTTDTFGIDDATITLAEIANSKEIVLYRYRQERLPEVKIKEYGKPLMNTVVGGFARLPEDKDARGINVSDVKTPGLHINRSLWQSIVQSFKKKKHVGQ